MEIRYPPFKYLLLVFMILKYLWQQYLNVRQVRRTLIRRKPPQMQSITQQEFTLGQSYANDKMYSRHHNKVSLHHDPRIFNMLALSIRMCVDCLIITANVLPFIWQNLDSIFPFVDMTSEFQRSIGYILLQAFISKSFNVPLSAYSKFLIDRKHTSNRITIGMFVYQIAVEGILLLIVAPPIIYGYLRIVQIGGDKFYVVVVSVVIGGTLIVACIHPILAPLFRDVRGICQGKGDNQMENKLKSYIMDLADLTEFPLSQIMISTTAQHSPTSHNAQFLGLFSQKIILLDASLLTALSPYEIAAVVCHEIGHWRHWHSLKQLFIFLLEVVCLFYIFTYFVNGEQICRSFGFQQKSVFVGTALFFHLFEPLTSIFELLKLLQTRSSQFQADSYACLKGYGRPLLSALKKLQGPSTTVAPDYLYAWLKNSHPGTAQRQQNIEKGIKQYDARWKVWQKQMQKQQ